MAADTGEPKQAGGDAHRRRLLSSRRPPRSLIGGDRHHPAPSRHSPVAARRCRRRLPSLRSWRRFPLGQAVRSDIVAIPAPGLLWWWPVQVVGFPAVRSAEESQTAPRRRATGRFTRQGRQTPRSATRIGLSGQQSSASTRPSVAQATQAVPSRPKTCPAVPRAPFTPPGTFYRAVHKKALTPEWLKYSHILDYSRGMLHLAESIDHQSNFRSRRLLVPRPVRQSSFPPLAAALLVESRSSGISREPVHPSSDTFCHVTRRTIGHRFPLSRSGKPSWYFTKPNYKEWHAASVRQPTSWLVHALLSNSGWTRPTNTSHVFNARAISSCHDFVTCMSSCATNPCRPYSLRL